MTTEGLDSYASPGAGAEELATLLSIAVQIEPELIRAVRLTFAPRRDVSAEADLWFSDWVGIRSAGAIRLRGELIPELRERLTARLAADRQDPAWQLWKTVSAVHAGWSPALLLEEQLTWSSLCLAAGDPAAGDVEELLRSALRAAVLPDRKGVADWFGAAWHRLPAAVQRTVPAWQLLQASPDRSRAAVVADDIPLNLADVSVLGDLIEDTTIRVRHDGWDLLLNYTGTAPAVLIPVPDTRPRILRVRWRTDQGREERTLRVKPEAAASLQVGGAVVRVQTGRGSVFQIEPPSGTGEPAEQATVLAPGPAVPSASREGPIWGGVPARNRTYAGRLALFDQLREALGTQTKVAVLGMAGVGKTQLVIEYVYRHTDQYDLVWWIPGEQIATVLTSLTQLAQRLGLPVDDDPQETARVMLDALASSDLGWLLVYDNADDPDSLTPFMPLTGGHVIITSRNVDWSASCHAIEIDVLTRAESIELLRRRTQDEAGDSSLSNQDADHLAEKLGDLPLALEQAAAWLTATAMPAREYIELLDNRLAELLTEGKPANYPLTVATSLELMVERLRETDPAATQFLELFAFLGGEPMPISLLRHGGGADVTEPLRGMLAASIATNRAVRDLSRYGVVKVNPQQTVQVHRLIQRVLRDLLSEELAAQTLRNVQNILAAANPGDPDEMGHLERQRDLGLHIAPADLIHAENPAARRVVLDHTRYLYLLGDYENSRFLAEAASAAWKQDTSSPLYGPDGEFTLLARGRLGDALRALGDRSRAAEIARDTYNRLMDSQHFGRRHIFTLITGNQIGHDLRLAGRYNDALSFDQQSVVLHQEVFGDGESYTRRAQAALASDYRLVGSYAEALRLDREIARYYDDVTAVDWQFLATHINLAQDYYSLGAYDSGLDVLHRRSGPLMDQLGRAHILPLTADRITANLLRKLGRHTEAADLIRDAQERTRQRLGRDHELTLAVAVSWANTAREIGELEEAHVHITDAVTRYRHHFGELHPLTLIAQHNEAIVRRSRGDNVAAQQLDGHCYAKLGETLSPDHPYTLCAGASLATDFALAGAFDQALELSRELFERGRQTSADRPEDEVGNHPYQILRAINLARDLVAAGEAAQADDILTESLAALADQLGHQHPLVLAQRRDERAEFDIEPLTS